MNEKAGFCALLDDRTRHNMTGAITLDTRSTSIEVLLEPDRLGLIAALLHRHAAPDLYHIPLNLRSTVRLLASCRTTLRLTQGFLGIIMEFMWRFRSGTFPLLAGASGPRGAHLDYGKPKLHRFLHKAASTGLAPVYPW